MDKLLLSIPELADRLGIGTSMAKKLIREGDILSVKIGDRRLIPESVLTEYIADLVKTGVERRHADLSKPVIQS